MPAFTAALFATKLRNDDGEKLLLAHALLFEGGRPYWMFPGNGPDTCYVPPDPKYILQYGVIGLLNLIDLSNPADLSAPIREVPANLIPPCSDEQFRELVEAMPERIQAAGLRFEIQTFKSCSIKNGGTLLGIWENSLSREEVKKMERAHLALSYGLVPASRYRRPGQK